MLKECNDAVLINDGLDPQLVLFYQVWRELTETKTFDTYQYKSINIINGLAEVIHNISVYLDGITKTDHLISSSCAELNGLVGRDVVLRTYYPSVQRRIQASINKKIDTTGKLKALRYQLQTYQTFLTEDYDKKLAELLAEHICTGAADIMLLTEQYISRCVDLGWSEKALHSKIECLKLPSEDDTATAVKRLLDKLINAPKQSFSVFFPYRIKVTSFGGKSKEDSTGYVDAKLAELGIQVLSKAEISSNYDAVDTSKLKVDKYLVKMVSSYDAFSASHLAIREVSRALSILSFFYAIESGALSTELWVVFNNDAPHTSTVRLNQLYGTYEYLDSSSTVFSRVLTLLGENSNNRSDVVQKIQSSLSFASLSRASTSLEEKYMNMWIALESLCLTDSFDNIIGSILKIVPDAVCLRYLYRVVRNFVEDCNRCEISFDFSTITINSRNPNKEEVVCSMMNLLRDPTGYTELKEHCLVNTLLSKRCEDIHKIVCDHIKLRETINKHHETVSWHLNRLYRIRNEIAHAAAPQNISTVRYIEHLYDYLATLVSETSRFTREYHVTYIGEVFSLISDNYNEFKEIAFAPKILDPSAQLGKLWTRGVIQFV